MKHLLWAATLVLAGATSARAATIQFTTEIDLGPCQPGFPMCAVQTPIATQVIAIGDVVDYTVTFADQRLVMTDLTGSSAFLFPFLGTPGVGGQFAIAGATGTLLGLQGSLTHPLVLATHVGGDSHLGPSFSGFIGAGNTISFTGYRIQFTVLGLPAAANTYSSNLFLAGASTTSVVADGQMPEPATLGLLGLGLSGMAAAARRRLRPQR